ncbi:MAG TPA: alpha/beta hydrolase [Actinomycetota bacterium]|nr:alpha/beta hydrolase [Actinomycetota bacterium]
MIAPPIRLLRPAARTLAAVGLVAGVLSWGLGPARAGVTDWTQASVCATPPVTPDAGGVPYSTPVAGVTLTLDVFEAAGPAPHPSLVVVHGGSFKSGCRGQIAVLSDRFRQAGFTVFDIAIRSSCKPTAPPATLDDPAYCGGHGVAPAPVQDIQAATSWLRENAPIYGGDPLHVAVFGDSSGGSEAMVAADTGVPAGSAPETVASWSGIAEMDHWADGTPSCDPANRVCVNARTNYIGCSVTACDPTWQAESPYDVATGTSPPTFLANGTLEKTTRYQEAVDYDAMLTGLGVAHELCSVDTSSHGQGLQDLACSESGQAVFDATVAFLLAHV